MTPNFKSLILSSFVGGVVMWGVAGVWHEVAAASFFAERLGGEHQGVGMILVAYLILALLMAYLFPRVASTGKPLVEGIKFGALIGLLWVLPHGLVTAAAHGEPLMYEFQNAAWHLIEQGIGGITIAFIYAKFTPAKNAGSTK